MSRISQNLGVTWLWTHSFWE